MRYLIFILFFASLNLFAQDKNRYHLPMEKPIFLSGNFGELRGNHFHAGIDIKTFNEIGKKVFAIEDGFVSRIKIQAGGYGKAIYIQHPDGKTSVYAHLDRYCTKIENYVKEIQYKKESFEINLLLTEDKFRIKKGELIAYSGNTGSSAGPHLHFEIRNTTNQCPVNPLYYYSIKDDRPAAFWNLAIYGFPEKKVFHPFSCDIIPIPGENKNKLHLPIPIQIPEYFGIGVEVYDLFSGVNNKFAPYSIELFIDSVLKYKHQMSSISFNETRYINAHIDFSQKQNKRNIHKLFKLPHNALSIYEKENSILQLNDDRLHFFELLATDIKGNVSSFSFYGKKNTQENTLPSLNNAKVLKHHEENRIENPWIKIELPAYSLYSDQEIPLSIVKRNESNIEFTLGNDGIPCHKEFKILVDVSILAKKNKIGLFQKTKESEEEKFSYIEGEQSENYLISNSRTFGTFVIKCDTIAPTVRFLNESNSKEQLEFQINDEGSGIYSYEGKINGKWALFEYDPKNDLLVYVIDKQRSGSGKNQQVEIVVKDYMNNTTTFEQTVFW